MCDCIAEVNVKLAPDQEIRGAILLRGGRMEERAALPIYRRDNGRLETRSGRPSSFIATFCPLCGDRYEPQEG